MLLGVAHALLTFRRPKIVPSVQLAVKNKVICFN